MNNWLTLLVIENDSSVNVVKELCSCANLMCADRHDEREEWLKWNVRGYSDKHLNEFVTKIEKQLSSIGDGVIKYEFVTE